MTNDVKESQPIAQRAAAVHDRRLQRDADRRAGRRPPAQPDRRPDRDDPVRRLPGRGDARGHLQAGAETVKLDGQVRRVRCQIRSISGFSAHADEGELLDWLGGFAAGKQPGDPGCPAARVPRPRRPGGADRARAEGAGPGLRDPRPALARARHARTDRWPASSTEGARRCPADCVLASDGLALRPVRAGPVARPTLSVVIVLLILSAVPDLARWLHPASDRPVVRRPAARAAPRHDIVGSAGGRAPPHQGRVRWLHELHDSANPALYVIVITDAVLPDAARDGHRPGLAPTGFDRQCRPRSRRMSRPCQGGRADWL